MRKGKFKFTNKNGAEEQVALETLLDQIVDSPIRALMPNTEYRKGEMIFDKELPLCFWVCVYAGMTGDKSSLNVLKETKSYGTVVKCGTAMFITHVTPSIPTMKTFDAYAKLESPHLTGIPTAPTASSNTNTTQIATTEFVKTALASVKIPEAVTVGTVIAFAGNSVPSGFLFCDGSAISRTTYAALYAVIGTTYGSGDGSTTFDLPNLTDKFIQGSDTAGTVKSAGLPNITGELDWSNANSNLQWEMYVNNVVQSGALSITKLHTNDYVDSGTGGNDFMGNILFNANKSNSIYGNSTTVQPPALTMRYIIKY